MFVLSLYRVVFSLPAMFRQAGWTIKAHVRELNMSQQAPSVLTLPPRT